MAASQDRDGPPVEPGWPDESGATHSRIRTRIALVAIVLLVAVASTESWYLWQRDDQNVGSVDRSFAASPVAIATALDTVATSMKEIVSTSYKNYDEQVDEAAGMMTDDFAEEYRQTAADIKEGLVRARTQVEVKITDQGVVDASPEQVEALVFLTRVVTRNGMGITATPYRALVTVVNTDRGWLVSDIETR